MNPDEYLEFTTDLAFGAVADTKLLNPEMINAMFFTLGLNGEVGEVTEHIKKWFRDGIFDRDAFKKEMGDVIWYFTQLAAVFGLTYDEITEANKEKLLSRVKKDTQRGWGDDR